MKLVLASTLLIGMVGVSLFGGMLFSMTPGHSGRCVASAIDGADCPTNINGFVMHHISALETFTRAVVPNGSDWFFALTLLLLGAVSTLFLKNKILPELQLLPQRLRDQELDSLCSRQKIVSWLSLFELSPAL